MRRFRPLLPAEPASGHARGFGAPSRLRARGALARAMAVLALLALGACTTVLARSPVPEDQLSAAKPYGITGSGPNGAVRSWGDTLDPGDPDDIVERYARLLRTVHADDIAAGRPLELSALTLSGGGPDGAFSAGLLKGWTDRGDRPEFEIVTGISTGAIVALFAFLGPDYDHVLEEIYTAYETDDLVTPTIFAGLTGGTALVDTRKYRGLIDRYLTEDVMDAIVEAGQEGRFLLIGTTNLDAARPVVWNVTQIAMTGHPDARALIGDVLQASSAIPAAFPPVLIPVEGADGRVYDEMHVDGGATQQVMLFSPELPLKAVDEELGVAVDRSIYVVINNKLRKPYDPVRPRLYAIAGTAVSSLLGGSGAGDIYKIFAIAQRDDLDLNITWIPPDFDVPSDEVFDPVYMRALFDLGYEYGLAGDRWVPRPPDFRPWPPEDG